MRQLEVIHSVRRSAAGSVKDGQVRIRATGAIDGESRGVDDRRGAQWIGFGRVRVRCFDGNDWGLLQFNPFDFYRF